MGELHLKALLEFWNPTSQSGLRRDHHPAEFLLSSSTIRTCDRTCRGLSPDDTRHRHETGPMSQYTIFHRRESNAKLLRPAFRSDGLGLSRHKPCGGAERNGLCHAGNGSNRLSRAARVAPEYPALHRLPRNYPRGDAWRSVMAAKPKSKNISQPRGDLNALRQRRDISAKDVENAAARVAKFFKKFAEDFDH